MRARLVLLWAPLCLYLVPNLPAQDAAKADPAHYKVVQRERPGKNFEGALWAG